VIVLEAQNRVGGRVLTCRDFAPGLYAEFGAMQIPRSHDLTLKYCAKFNLAMTPFVMGNTKALVHIGGERMTMEEAQRSPERLPFDLAPHERGKTADQLWMAAIADIKALLDRDGPSAWEQIRTEFDQFSLYEFLKHRNFSSGAIEYYGVMNFVEADMNNAVMEVLREDLEGAYLDMQTIDGGMDRLPRAFYAELEQEVRFGAEVRAIDQTDADVTVHYKTEAGHFSIPAKYDTCEPFTNGLARIEIGKRFGWIGQQAARHPPAELPRVDEDPVPGPASLLGRRGRDRRWGDRD
jgi:monoamine oxidase